MYVNAGKTTDFVEGEIYQVDVGGWPIDFAHVGGRFFAFGDECPHWGVSFVGGNGFVTNRRTVVCLYHDSTFDLQTGRPVSGVAHDYLPTYNVRIENGEVFVGWDDETPATEQT